MDKTKLQLIDDNQVSEHYRKFFERFSEIDSVPLVEWKPSPHILSYLCRKYEQYYGFKFTFGFKASPSKSREVYEVKKLANMISSDPNILKNYVDWIFEKKIIERKKKITSLGYFTNTEIVNEFKFKFLFNKQEINRATRLPDRIIEALQKQTLIKEAITITTYGELAFLNNVRQSTSYGSLKSNDYEILFALLPKIDGFNLDILGTIK